MAIKYDNVIIFGPTGATGSAAAQEAAKRGAKVWLAMRDPSKTIKNLDESTGKFERVKADLSDAASVKQAVEKSGAKAAYTYQVHGSKDAMRATIDAMKEAGIEYVVFLSSFTIFPDQDIRSIGPERIIPYAHSSVEATIEDTGLDATMLRPGAFAYNTFVQNLKRDEEPWRGVIPESTRVSDGIVPRDIGRVGGAVLVDRPSADKKHIIYLYGPKLTSREEQLETASRVLGREIRVDVKSQDDFIQHLTKGLGFPEFIAKYLVTSDNGQYNDTYYANGRHEEGVANVKKYSGVEATTLEQFIKEYFA